MLFWSCVVTKLLSSVIVFPILSFYKESGAEGSLNHIVLTEIMAKHKDRIKNADEGTSKELLLYSRC